MSVWSMPGGFTSSREGYQNVDEEPQAATPTQAQGQRPFGSAQAAAPPAAQAAPQQQPYQSV